MTDRGTVQLDAPPPGLGNSYVIVTTPERMEAEACLKLAAAFTAEAVIDNRMDDARHGAREVRAVIAELYGEGA